MKVQAFSKIEPVGAYILPVNGTTVQEYLIDRYVFGPPHFFSNPKSYFFVSSNPMHNFRILGQPLLGEK